MLYHQKKRGDQLLLIESFQCRVDLQTSSFLEDYEAILNAKNLMQPEYY